MEVEIDMAMSTMGADLLEMVSDEELANIAYEEQLLYAHNFHFVPKDSDFGDNRFRDDITKYFCWRGITEIVYPGHEGEWLLAEQCDPASYTAARTRFCLTFGCLQPFRYSPFKPGEENEGDEVPNRRGGIIVANNIEECAKGGAGTGLIKCVTTGLKESISHSLEPDHKSKIILSGIALAITFLVLVRIAKRRKSKRRR
jgi:hypothetical protein